MSVKEITPENLKRRKTLRVGQAHDLKIDSEIDGIPTRYWLARCGRADGNTHAVDVEQCVDGRWVTVHRYGEPSD